MMMQQQQYQETEVSNSETEIENLHPPATQLGSSNRRLSQDARRKTRAQLRGIADQLDTNRAEYVNDPTLLTQHLENLDQLQEQVACTTESALDSKLLLTVTQIVQERIHSLKLGHACFNVNDFINRTIRFADNKQHDLFTELGLHFGPYLDSAPAVQFMLGPMDVMVRTREIVRRTRSQLNEKQIAKTHGIMEHTRNSSQSDSSQTKVLVQSVHQILLQSTNVPLFAFVLNPQSFAQTVENMFFVAFLIKDGLAGVGKAKEFPHDIEVWGWLANEAKRIEVDAQNDKQDRVQWIPSLTMSEWKDLIELYGYTSARYIPHRDYSCIPD